MMLTNAGVDTATAAARRRQRRLRSWLRHERMTVAMLLAESDHHTAPRGQKQARSGREERKVNYEPRPLDPPLTDGAATVGYVAAPVPLLVPPVLGGGDTMDAAAVQFLLAQSLLQRQREEEAAQRLVKEAEEAKEKEERKTKFEEKLLVVNRRVRDGSATPAEEAAWRRWMGLVPGSSSSSSGGRGRKRGRGSFQVFFWCAVSTLRARVPLSLFFFWCAGFPSVDDRPKMLDIMDGTEQKDFFGMCKAWFAGT